MPRAQFIEAFALNIAAHPHPEGMVHSAAQFLGYWAMSYAVATGPRLHSTLFGVARFYNSYEGIRRVDK
jgi:hypothetical protein